MLTIDAQSWMAFTASQTISTLECAFDWRARAGPFGMISALDALTDSEGHCDITALGMIPIARAEHTPALMRGELMRYLAELAWAPDAILLNSALRWRVDSADTLAVSAGSGATAGEVALRVDEEGRIASAVCPGSTALPHSAACRRHGEAVSPIIAIITACGFHLRAKLHGNLTVRISFIGKPV